MGWVVVDEGVDTCALYDLFDEIKVKVEVVMDWLGDVNLTSLC